MTVLVRFKVQPWTLSTYSYTQCLALELKRRPNMDEVVRAVEQLQEPGDMPKKHSEGM